MDAHGGQSHSDELRETRASARRSPPVLPSPMCLARRYPRIENLRDTMAAWPFHFLLMLEALRDFRRRN